MKIITNISNITDSSGTTPIITYSNAVQTVVKTPVAPQNNCTIVFIDCNGRWRVCSDCNMYNQIMQNLRICSPYNHCSCACNCSCRNCCNNMQACAFACGTIYF